MGKCPDFLSFYATPKIVKIRDSRLGILKFAMLLCITLYVILYQILYQAGYLKTAAPDGAVRFQLQQPVKNGCTPFDPGCTDDFPPLTGIDYCSQCTAPQQRKYPRHNCTYWDALQAGNMQESAISVTFRVTEFQQVNTCPRGVTNCTLAWTTIGPESVFFIASTKNFTLLFDHSVLSPIVDLFFDSRDMRGLLYVPDIDYNSAYLCDKAGVDITGNNPQVVPPCYLKPGETSDNLDFFTLGTLFKAGGKCWCI